MANRKSDIYSLGIVMFELLTGRLPFSGESAVSIALKHLQSETPSLRRWNPSIPQSVENIVFKATAKDPFHRYDSVEEVEEDIRTALEPDRMNEEMFIVPIDNDATKAIPIITDSQSFSNMDETVIRDKDVKGNHTHQDIKPKKEKNVKKEQKKRKKWTTILVSTFFALIILGIFVVFVLPDLLAPDEISVPELTGEKADDAVKQLEEAGFSIGETIQINDDELDEGLIIKTDPKAGTVLKEGAMVDLYESLGKEKFELDDYTGQSYDDVVRLLEKSNFKSENIEKKEVNDESKPAGTILEQSKQEGELVVPEDTELIFTVSKGPTPITLKDLTDYNKKGLQEYEESTGVVIEFGIEEYSDSVSEGLVIWQKPNAGAQVTKGSKVKVAISKGKKEIPPKTKFVEVTVPYEPVIEGQPQEVQIYINDMNRSITDPFITEYITETRKFRLELEIQHGQKAVYQVRRDNTVIDQQEVLYPE